MEIKKIESLESDSEIQKVVEVLRNGGLIVYPTETLYGLGVDATSDSALEKLWAFKGERGDKPVLVAVDGQEMSEKYVEISLLGKKVIQNYWPGSVAIVAKSRGVVSKKAQGKTETLGLRMVDNKIVLKIVTFFGKPITSTSANVSGEVTARSLDEFLETVPKEKQDLIDLFIDAGEIPESLPSTIVDTTGKELRVLRQGKVSVKS